MTVLHVAAALADDVGVRLEQADQLLAGRHRQAFQYPTLALGENGLDQRQIMAEPGAPPLGPRPGDVGQLFGGFLQGGQGCAGGGDQLTIEPAPVVFATAVLNRSRALFGQAPAIAPLAVPALPAMPQLAAIAAS